MGKPLQLIADRYGLNHFPIIEVEILIGECSGLLLLRRYNRETDRAKFSGKIISNAKGKLRLGESKYRDYLTMVEGVPEEEITRFSARLTKDEEIFLRPGDSYTLNYNIEGLPWLSR